MASSWRWGAIACAGIAAALAVGTGARAESRALPADAQQIVQAATRPASVWGGPRAGPAGAKAKSIALVAEDLRNGGILGVAQGIREAAKVLGWKVRVFDAAGSTEGRDRAAADALAAAPDGLIVVGADVRAMQARLQPFARRGIPMVGWHVASEAGPVPNSPMAMNVSTDPIEVARITAMAAVVGSGGRAGVVIFTDSNFEIAMTKAKAMAYVIRACQDCTLLEIRDVAISHSGELMPAVTRELLARYGSRWTHALAINDIYFDYAVPELIKAGLPGDRLHLLSAGDGSAAAFLRIQARAFQTGTVAEPLNLHGWQLVDEINRLLSGQPVSGYVMPVHLITGENVAYDGGPRLQFDPDNGYRDAYRRIWQR